MFLMNVGGDAGHKELKTQCLAGVYTFPDD